MRRAAAHVQSPHGKTCTATPSPSLPVDVVKIIVKLSERFRDLSALSMLSWSWKSGCQEVMAQVRSLALNALALKEDKLILGRQRTLAYAGELAASRLINRAFNGGFTGTPEHAQLSNNLVSLWQMSAAAPGFTNLVEHCFYMRGLQESSWKALVGLTPDKTAMNLLAFDPYLRAAINPESLKAITTSAAETLNAVPELGTLREYALHVQEIGRDMEYKPPFDKVLFASLLFRPQAFYALLQIAGHLSTPDFLSVAARVSHQFKSDANVMLGLTLATARQIVKSSEETPALSGFPLTTLLRTVQDVYDKCVRLKCLSPEQYQLVVEVRGSLLPKLARSASAILKTIPAKEHALRKDVQTCLDSMSDPKKWKKSIKRSS